MRVADVMPEDGPFLANFTNFWHDVLSFKILFYHKTGSLATPGYILTIAARLGPKRASAPTPPTRRDCPPVLSEPTNGVPRGSAFVLLWAGLFSLDMFKANAFDRTEHVETTAGIRFLYQKNLEFAP